MKIRLDDLLKLIGRDEDREELLRLARQYLQSQEGREPLLDQLAERIEWYFRALRHPLPSRQEIAQMIDEDLK